LTRNDNPDEANPTSSKNLLKPIGEKHYPRPAKSTKATVGRGLHSERSIFLPSDPTALLQRLDKLLASKQAGNTGVRNEAFAICDELERFGRVNDEEYELFNQMILRKYRYVRIRVIGGSGIFYTIMNS
jgi:hypothetical protein